MIKRISMTAALLLLLTGAALAQTQAHGPTLTLTVIRGNAFVRGSVIRASGRIFCLNCDSQTRGLWTAHAIFPNGQEKLRLSGASRDELTFSLNTDMTDATAIRIDGPGFSELVPLTGPATPATAKPTIRAQGRYTSFQNPIGQAFDGSITFAPGVGIINISFLGSDFGGENPWVLEIVGNGLFFELSAFATELGQGQDPYFTANIPFLPPGLYQLQIRAQNVAGIVSNVLSLPVN